ncbi:MAG: radical SAM protein [Clostridiales bacterium]|nr:radical SAM protein [Clostridiales bacterium]
MSVTDVTELKRSQLESLARHRESLRKTPNLRWLFFEITDRCNLSCRHCGSSCTTEGRFLTTEDIDAVLKSVKAAGVNRPTVCLTGGEPMLHPDFYEIAQCVRDNGFYWGMTTNATLIDDAAAAKLRQAGMSTVSVSLDGMEELHDSLRQRKGAWRLALRGIESLQKAGFEPQVTTVIHQGNFNDLEPLYDLLSGMGVTNWRPINVEPIGRACESGDLLLSPKQLDALLSYIRSKRFDPGNSMEVTFGCSHYLGVEYERMVRDHYFLCGAGILTASVRSNGDICACLDIENRPELVQGNIRKDDFMEVWQDRFEAFRRDRTAGCEKCAACPERFICGGDSTHTWDFDKNEPLLCYRDCF